jgi:hypothetical protein
VRRREIQARSSGSETPNADAGLALFGDLRRQAGEPRLPRLDDHAVEQHDPRQAFGHPLGHAECHQRAEAVPDQHHAGQLLTLQHRDDVLHDGGRPDLGTQQVRALTETRERRGEHVVAGRTQQRRHPRPAPAAVAGPVNQNEGHGAEFRR